MEKDGVASFVPLIAARADVASNVNGRHSVGLVVSRNCSIVCVDICSVFRGGKRHEIYFKTWKEKGAVVG